MQNVLEYLVLMGSASAMHQEVCPSMARVNHLNCVEMSLRPGSEEVSLTPVDAGHPLPPSHTVLRLLTLTIVGVTSSRASRIFRKRSLQARRR